VVEFIRFEAFADEYTRQLGRRRTSGGCSAGSREGAQPGNGWRTRPILLSRMPRLAEWHAEAAAANILARPDLTEALSALKRSAEVQQVLPEALKALEALDSRLAGMPAALAGAVGKQPELRRRLPRSNKPGGG